MNDEIEKLHQQLPGNANVEEYINTGKGPQIGHVDTVELAYHNFFLDSAGRKTAAGRDYYSLIIGYDPFEKDHFTVTEDRALTEYISDEMKQMLLPLTKDKIEDIKIHPALIAEECAQFCAENHEGVVAFISDIVKRENGYEIYFQKCFRVNMVTVWQELFNLGIRHQFELTRTHWTVKQIDLMEVLQDSWMSMLPRGI